MIRCANMLLITLTLLVIFLLNFGHILGANAPHGKNFQTGHISNNSHLDDLSILVVWYWLWQSDVRSSREGDWKKKKKTPPLKNIIGASPMAYKKHIFKNIYLTTSRVKRVHPIWCNGKPVLHTARLLLCSRWSSGDTRLTVLRHRGQQLCITVWTVVQAVLTLTFNSYGDRQISTPYKINTPEPIQKISAQLINPTSARGPPVPNLVQIDPLRAFGQMAEI